MDAIANNYTSIVIFLFSGILGTLGQSVSVWIGLNDLVYNKNSLKKHAIVGSYISGSTFIGFIAGLFVNALQSFPNTLSFEWLVIAIASGYISAEIFEYRKK